MRTPVRLEVWSAEPVDDSGAWDHEVDIDFDVPYGRLNITHPAAPLTAVAVRIPPGRYRVRVSGRGFTAVGADGDDSYRLRFWPRDRDTDPVLRKRWRGWEPSLRHAQAEKARIEAARKHPPGRDQVRPGGDRTPRPQRIVTAVVVPGQAFAIDDGGPDRDA